MQAFDGAVDVLKGLCSRGAIAELFQELRDSKADDLEKLPEEEFKEMESTAHADHLSSSLGWAKFSYTRLLGVTPDSSLKVII